MYKQMYVYCNVQTFMKKSEKATQQPEAMITKYARQTVPVKDEKWCGKAAKEWRQASLTMLRLHFVGEIV